MEYRFEDEKSPGRVGKICKGAALLLIAAVFALLLFRMCTDDASGSMQEYLITPATIDLSAPISAFSQTLPKDLDEVCTEAGNRFAFQISELQYAPEAGELQLTVRYNKSLQKELLREYAVTELPAGEWFLFALEDQDRKFYTEYVYLSDTRNVNRFRRLAFSGIDFGTVQSLTLCVYPALDSQAEPEKPLFSIPVYQLPSEVPSARGDERFTVVLPAPKTEGLSPRPDAPLFEKFTKPQP